MNSAALITALVLMVIIPGATAWLVRRQTRSMGKFGLGPLKVCCPNCNAVQLFIRKPTSLRQMMFGGYSCVACGTEIDKYGRVQEA